jgi:hypothetical protein
MADGLAPVKRLNADTVGEFNANRFLTQISERTSQDVANEVRGNLNNPNSIVNRTLAENTRKLDTLIGKVDIIADDTKYIRRVVRKIEKGGLGTGSTGGSFLGDAFNWVVGGAAAKAAMKALRFLGPGGGTVSAAFLAYEIARMAAKKAGVTDKEMDDKMSYLVTGKQNQTTIKTAITNATRRYLAKHGLIRATPKIPIRIRDVNNHRLAIQRAMLNDAKGAMNALGDSARTALTGTEFKYLGTYVIMAGIAARAIYRSVWEIDIERDPIKDPTRASQIIDEVLAVLDAIPKDQNVNKTTQTRKPRPAADNQTRAAQTAQQTQQSTLPTAAAAPVIASTGTGMKGSTAPATAPSTTAAPSTAAAPSTQSNPGQLGATPQSRASEPIKPDDLSKPMTREQSQGSAGILPPPQTSPSTVAPTSPYHHPAPVPVPTPQQLDPGVGVPGAVPPTSQASAVHGGPDQTFGTPSEVKPVDTGPAAESLQPAPKETVKGDDKEASAVNFFMGKGWSRAQASAIVGNLKTESKLNPQAHNAGEDARGVAQWRFDRITAIENKFGKPVLEMSRQEQLEAVHWELTEGGKKKVGDHLKTINDVKEAAAYVDKRFEVSSGGARAERVANAESLYSRETVANTDAGSKLEEINATQGSMKVLRGHLKGVDPRLVDVLQQTSKNSKYDVQMISGNDSRNPLKIKNSQHPKGQAIDIQLVDKETGKVVPNYQSAEGFRAYEEFAQSAKTIQMDKYPELNKEFRWGGYFSGGKGKYGANDPMHFDIGTKGAMAGGSFAEGLTKDQRKQFPGIESKGMGDLDKALETHRAQQTTANEKKNNAEVKADVKPLEPEHKDLAPTQPTSAPDPLTEAPKTPAQGLDAINATRSAGPDDKLSKPSQFRVTPGYLTRKALEHGKGGEDGFNPVDSIPESQKRKVNMDPKTKAFTANQEELAALKKKAGSMFDMGFSVTPMAKGGQFDTSGPTLVPSQQGPVLMGERGTEKVTVTPKEKLPPPHRLSPTPQPSPVSETHPEPTRAQDGTPLQSRDIGRPHTSAAPTRSQHPRPPMSYLLANDLRNHKGFVGNVADYGLSGLTNLTPDQR